MKNLKLIMKEKTWKVFVITLVINLILIGIYFYFYTAIQAKNQHIAELKANIEDLTIQKDSLKSARDNISKTAELQKEIDNYFIPKDGVVQFPNLLDTLGSENKLTSNVLSVVKESTAENADISESLKIELEVYGAWADVYHFGALLELLPYKVTVGRVNLEKLPEDFNKGSVGNLKQINIATRPWKGTFNFSILKFK